MLEPPEDRLYIQEGWKRQHPSHSDQLSLHVLLKFRASSLTITHLLSPTRPQFCSPGYKRENKPASTSNTHSNEAQWRSFKRTITQPRTRSRAGSAGAAVPKH